MSLLQFGNRKQYLKGMESAGTVAWAVVLINTNLLYTDFWITFTIMWWGENMKSLSNVRCKMIWLRKFQCMWVWEGEWVKKNLISFLFIFGVDVSRTPTSIQTLQIYSKRRTELRFHPLESFRHEREEEKEIKSHFLARVTDKPAGLTAFELMFFFQSTVWVTPPLISCSIKMPAAISRIS